MKFLPTILKPAIPMLKDNRIPDQNIYGSISVTENHEIDQIWAFIDTNISGFVLYYHSVGDSDKENRITDFLIHYLQQCKFKQFEGFSLYDFRSQPTQQQSGKKTDIGVFLIRSETPVPLIEFEAKRLSDTSNNKEYVCGERGGIERFKREKHAPHLSVCGMFGYVQSRTINHWRDKINAWIYELSDTNTDKTIYWSKEDILTKQDSFSKVEKYLSHHRRFSLNSISLWHYFIEL
jgi:hypothetical protein